MVSNFKLHQINTFSGLLTGIVGFSFLLFPSYFWNPQDGVSPFKFIKPGTYESNELDAATSCGLRGSGAIMVGFALFPLLAGRKQAETKSYLRLKTFHYAMHALILAHTAWMGFPDLVRGFFVFFALLKGYFSVSLALALRGCPFPEAPKSKNMNNTMIAAAVSLVYIVPFALIMIFAPWQLSPVGRLPHFIDKTVEGVATAEQGFDDVQTFAMRFEGVNLLACCFMMLDYAVRKLQLTPLNFLGADLYFIAFGANLFDQTGYVDKTQFRILLFVHVVYVALLHFLTAEKETTAAVAKETKLPEKKRKAPVPDLLPESMQTKKVD